MRLIDADAIKYNYLMCSETNDPAKMAVSKDKIDAMPTVHLEREKGEWIEALVAGMPSIYHEKCGAFVYAPNGKKGFNFCPNCGAYMNN